MKEEKCKECCNEKENLNDFISLFITFFILQNEKQEHYTREELVDFINKSDLKDREKQEIISKILI